LLLSSSSRLLSSSFTFATISSISNYYQLMINITTHTPEQQHLAAMYWSYS
jgi:hypothetical protein